MIKLSNRINAIHRTPVYFGENALAGFNGVVVSLRPSSVYILTDQHTKHFCLPLLMATTTVLTDAQILELPAGEHSKKIENAEKLWETMSQSGADRASLLVNLGGGVITDLGGFVAAGYRRGIRYINVPTSLIGQADAAIGGKTAVNLGSLKNQIGFFYPAEAVFITTLFLKTLPPDHLRSGMAEVLKSMLLGNALLWRKLSSRPFKDLIADPAENAFSDKLVRAAVTYKNKVVERDFNERDQRKALNFGHTIGHALESFALESMEKPLLHGEAIAAGMICATFLSHLKTGLPEKELNAITNYIVSGFGVVSIPETAKSRLMELVMFDKKMIRGQLKFTLIAGPGRPKINVVCDQQEISDAIDFYCSLSKRS